MISPKKPCKRPHGVIRRTPRQPMGRRWTGLIVTTESNSTRGKNGRREEGWKERGRLEGEREAGSRGWKAWRKEVDDSATYLDLARGAAVQLSHTPNLTELHVVAALHAVTRLVQACDNTLLVTTHRGYHVTQRLLTSRVADCEHISKVTEYVPGRLRRDVTRGRE